MRARPSFAILCRGLEDDPAPIRAAEAVDAVAHVDLAGAIRPDDDQNLARVQIKQVIMILSF